MPDTITTTPTSSEPWRPVPPSWATVAPLLQRWQMALIPYPDGSWDLLAGYPRGWDGPRLQVHGVAFADVPQMVAYLAEQCSAAAKGETRA
jgi:hypothetical protein